jgi:hypothetical protein
MTAKQVLFSLVAAVLPMVASALQRYFSLHECKIKKYISIIQIFFVSLHSESIKSSHLRMDSPTERAASAEPNQFVLCRVAREEGQ